MRWTFACCAAIAGARHGDARLGDVRLPLPLLELLLRRHAREDEAPRSASRSTWTGRGWPRPASRPALACTQLRAGLRELLIELGRVDLGEDLRPP